MSRTVRVGLGDRAYDVVVGEGLLDQAGVHLAPLLKQGRTAIVSDETVWKLHGQKLTDALAAAGISSQAVVVPPGEPTKSWDGLSDVCDRLLELELDRGDLIIAFGGGVVGDLAGFAAAIYKRGVDFIHTCIKQRPDVATGLCRSVAAAPVFGDGLQGIDGQHRQV